MITRDEIIKMAREAGMHGMLADVVCTHEELERFAALVAAAEREACAKLENEAGVYSKHDLADAIRAREPK